MSVAISWSIKMQLAKCDIMVGFQYPVTYTACMAQNFVVDNFYNFCNFLSCQSKIPGYFWYKAQGEFGVKCTSLLIVV